MKKKLVSYKIDEKLVEMFQVTTAIKNENLSDVVERLIRDYCIINKAQVNEAIKEFDRNNE